MPTDTFINMRQNFHLYRVSGYLKKKHSKHSNSNWFLSPARPQFSFLGYVPKFPTMEMYYEFLCIFFTSATVNRIAKAWSMDSKNMIQIHHRKTNLLH